MTDLTNIDFVFLDRDGVLNRKARPGEYITSCDEFVLLPGVPEAIAALNRSGRRVIVVTNQRGIALGRYSLDDLNRIHEKMVNELAVAGAHLDAIYFCPHDEGECSCRKPRTGMFEEAFRDFPGATAECSIMVGDSLRDIEAGMAVGMATVLVTSDDTMSRVGARARFLASTTVASLSDLVAMLFPSLSSHHDEPTNTG